MINRNKQSYLEQANSNGGEFILSNHNQKENKEHKRKQLDREEFGYGYDISVDDLDTLGQNEAAKKNRNRTPNHPVNNEEKQ